MSEPSNLGSEELSRAIITRPGNYTGVRPSADVAHAFVNDLDLMLYQQLTTVSLEAPILCLKRCDAQL